jgi:hypothetical protein
MGKAFRKMHMQLISVEPHTGGLFVFYNSHAVNSITKNQPNLTKPGGVPSKSSLRLILDVVSDYFS